MVENLAFFSSEKLGKMEVENLGLFLFAADAFPTAQSCCTQLHATGAFPNSKDQRDKGVVPAGKKCLPSFITGYCAKSSFVSGWSSYPKQWVWHSRVLTDMVLKLYHKIQEFCSSCFVHQRSSSICPSLMLSTLSLWLSSEGPWKDYGATLGFLSCHLLARHGVTCL